jgi:PAS domain S-box-containing protein
MARKSVAKSIGTKNVMDVHDAAHLEAVFASIGEGAIVTDQNGLITKVNQAALSMLGYRKSEVLRKRFPEKVIALHDNGAEIDILDRPIVKAYMTGETITEHTTYRRKDGSLFPTMVTVSPIMLHRKPIGAIEVFRDLSTEIQNDKLKSDFISIASHQLRTPLSAINMYTRMLQDGMAGQLTEQQRNFTQIVLGSVGRMNELIDTLLNITRIEAGGLSIKQQQLRIDELLANLLIEFTPAAEKKKISLSSMLHINKPEVVSDSLLLREVCSNLIGNAIKYTPENGSVHVSLTDTGKNITCHVTDTGYGIPLKEQKYIFTKFFRAENISKQDVSGTGLGLYLTKALVEQLGGEVWFNSRENDGTTFSFSIPSYLNE